MTVSARFAMTALLLSTAPASTASGASEGPAAAAGSVPAIRCDVAVDDAAVTAAILSRLAWSSVVDAADVRVSSANGTVAIRGFVPTELQKAQAGQIALDTYGVARVNNQLDVVYWTPRTEAWRVGAESRKAERLRAHAQADDQIAAALRFALSFSRAIDTCAIDVSSVDGSVTLRGTVRNQAGFDTAVALATDTLGVRSVDVAGLRQ